MSTRFLTASLPLTHYIVLSSDGASVIHTASALLVAHETVFSSWIAEASLIFTFRENLSTYASVWPTLWNGRHFAYCNQASSFGIPYIPPFPVCFGVSFLLPIIDLQNSFLSSNSRPLSISLCRRPEVGGQLPSRL